MEKHASTQETVRGQNVFEWYEALISAALVYSLKKTNALHSMQEALGE